MVGNDKKNLSEHEKQCLVDYRKKSYEMRKKNFFEKLKT